MLADKCACMLVPAPGTGTGPDSPAEHPLVLRGESVRHEPWNKLPQDLEGSRWQRYHILVTSSGRALERR